MKTLYILVIVALMHCCSGCDEEREPGGFTSVVEVSGLVSGYYCCVEDTPLLYQPRTHQPVQMYIERDNGKVYTCAVDPMSSYIVRVPVDTYNFILASRWSYPDTIANVNISSDSVLDFDLPIDFRSDSLDVYFYYFEKTPRLSEQEELAYVDHLILLAGDTWHGTDPVKWVRTDDSLLTVNYYRFGVPLNRDVWEQFDCLHTCWEQNRPSFPAIMHVAPSVPPPCGDGAGAIVPELKGESLR